MLTCISVVRKAAVGLLAVATSLQAAGATNIVHEKIACVPPGDNAKLLFKLEAGTGIASVRVNFHAGQYQTDYYLEMRHGLGGTYWAVLPKPLGETKEVVYRFRVVDIDGKEYLSDEYKVSVSSPCAVPLSAQEKTYSENLVIGILDMKMPVVPQGFKCDGIVGMIAVKDGEDGVLMPHDECRKVLAALAVVVPPGVYLAAGAAAAVGTGIVVSGGGGSAPVSPIRPAANTGTTPK